MFALVFSSNLTRRRVWSCPATKLRSTWTPSRTISTGLEMSGGGRNPSPFSETWKDFSKTRKNLGKISTFKFTLLPKVVHKLLITLHIRFNRNQYVNTFPWLSGHSKKCTLQQYELNLSSLGCNSRRPPRIEHVCGEFSCKDLIFPFYGDGKRVKLIWKSGEMREDGKPVLLYPPDYPSTTTNVERNESRSFFYFKGRLDVRFVVFLTILPIVIFGMLVFSLEIIIYITCMRY